MVDLVASRAALQTVQVATSYSQLPIENQSIRMNLPNQALRKATARQG